MALEKRLTDGKQTMSQFKTFLLERCVPVYMRTCGGPLYAHASMGGKAVSHLLTLEKRRNTQVAGMSAAQSSTLLATPGPKKRLNLPRRPICRPYELRV